jgi:hypothetical protein
MFLYLLPFLVMLKLRGTDGPLLAAYQTIVALYHITMTQLALPGFTVVPVAHILVNIRMIYTMVTRIRRFEQVVLGY